jgi:phospholipid/cholesterol/gamma-HCH transport system substrate-binding protein
MSGPGRKTTRYNQEFFREWGGLGPLAVGLIAIGLIAAFLFYAFTKSIPFTDPGYEVRATFANAVDISQKSPIRIAGINVGRVTEVEPKGDATVVTFTVDEEGRPIHTDAAAQIRPRLFLEGNWFIDLDPGTPTAPVMEEKGEIPISRTGTSVQIGDVLRNVLQLPQRAYLQKLLAGLGEGLTRVPNAEDDRTFEPLARGLTGGQSLNLAYRNGPVAARGTAIVNEAYLGEGPNDLRNVLRGLGRLTGTLNERQDDVTGFIRNFEIFTGALAAESANLAATVRELGPTVQTARISFTSLNRAIPAVRGFAVAAEPGIDQIPKTIRLVTPLTEQLKPLLTQSELGGLAEITVRTTPDSALSASETLGFLAQLTDYSKCVSGNIVPTGEQVITDGGLGNGQKASRQPLYAAVNVAGATSTFDGNGPFTRFQIGGGPPFNASPPQEPGVPVKMDDPLESGILTPLYGRTQTAPLGTSPLSPGLPPIVTSARCYTQDVPDLNGPAAGPGPVSPEPYTP